MTPFPFAHVILPGDEQHASDLLPDVQAALDAALARSPLPASFFALCVGASAGALGILQGAMCTGATHPWGVTRQISPQGPRLLFSRSLPAVPSGANAVLDAQIADTLSAAIAPRLVALESRYLVHPCPGATPGALVHLFRAGGGAGWNVSRSFQNLVFER